MSMSKDSIKKELIDKSNEILKKYDESYVVDDIAILNTAKNTSFLGNLRVFNDDNVKKIQGEIEKAFKDIGVLKVLAVHHIISILVLILQLTNRQSLGKI